MSDEKNLESADAGSSKTVDPNAANMAGSGESTAKTEDDKGEDNKGEANTTNYTEAQYKELEVKLGSQGKELGDNRKFIEEITPLMEKLQGKTELVEAIMNDKISPELMQSVADGTVTTKEAKDVTKAHDDVKKDLGDKGYDKTSQEDIKKLVADKIGEVRQDFKKTLDEKDQQNEYDDKLKSFINNTPDFEEHTQTIAKYLQENPSVIDVKVAYDAVTGIALRAKYAKQEEKDAADLAKDIAGNAGGGSGQNSANMSKEDLLDKLIGKAKDPNQVF